MLSSLYMIRHVTSMLWQFYYTKVTFVVAPPPLVGCADEVDMTRSASDMCVTVSYCSDVSVLMNVSVGVRSSHTATIPANCRVVGIFNCVFAIVADLIVLVLTCMKTIEAKRTAPAEQSNVRDSFNTLIRNRQLSYATLIQRDGTISRLQSARPAYRTLLGTIYFV